MDNSKKQISLGAVISYIAIAINMLTSLIYTPWMISSIGSSDYAIYSLATSLISIFMVDFGISSAVSRFLSKYRAEHNQQKIDDMLGIVYKLFLVIDACFFVVLIVIYFLIDIIYKGLTPEEIDKFKILYLIVASFSLFSFPFTTLSGILTAYEKFIFMKLCDVFHKLFGMTLIILALINGYGVVAVVTCNAISGIVTIIIKLIVIKSKTPIHINFSYKSKELLKEIFTFSIWVTVFTIAERITYNSAPTIMGIVSTSDEIAFFSPAALFSSYLYSIAVAINGLFLPSVSRKIAGNKEKEIMPLMIGIGRYQMVVLGLCFVGFAVIGKDFIATWIGPKFATTYYCALLLMFPSIIDYPQQIAKTIIVAKGLVKWQAIGLLASGIINIPFSLLMSSKYGAVGAAGTICICSLLNIVYINCVYIKVLKLDMWSFYKQCYFRIIIPIVATLLIAHQIVERIPIDGWWGIGIKAVITACIYFILVLIFFIKKEDIKLIMDLFRNKVLKKIDK